jgi:hypothetical protein
MKNNTAQIDPDADELASYGFGPGVIPTKTTHSPTLTNPTPGQVDKRFKKTYNSPDQVPFCKPDLL